MNQMGEVRATQETVSVEKVLTRMREYRDNQEAARRLQAEYHYEIGYNLTQDISTADGSQRTEHGHNDSTARNALDRIETMNELVTKAEYPMRWVENRQDRIQDERLALIFALRLQGYSVFEITSITRKSKRHVHRVLRECAEVLVQE